MSRLAPTSAVLAALALAAWAPGAAAQVPVPELPIDPVAAEIPQSSAISEQYRAVEDAVAEALPAAPEPAPAPPAEPDPAPKPAPAERVAEQYHSETPTNVSVTQEQPSNVNVSIRINSPGDDGPVVQINNAGGTAVDEQVVEAVRKPTAPAPAADAPPAALPETWEWVWTSACFAGAARAAAAVPGWSWRWSCDDGRAQDVPGGPAGPDAWPLAGMPDFAEALAVAAPSLPFAGAPARSRAERAPPARRRDGAAAAGGPAAGPPPIALARSLAAATTTASAAVAEPVRDVVRTVARARPGRAGASSLLFPPGEGPAAGASNAPGAAASLLLGIWIAVLITAIVLVLPRIRRRRWSGPAWRLTRGPSARLERPG